MDGDYHVTVRIRNGRIIRRMRELGIPSLAELARLAAVNYQAVAKLAAMKELPVNRRGEWREMILGLSSALRCQPEDLFNDQQKTQSVKTNSGETFVDLGQAMAIARGGYETSDAKITAQKLLSALTERERHVVVSVSEGASFEEAGKFTEIGEGWDVTAARARQIHERGIRKMRAASRRMEKDVAWKEQIGR